MGINYGKTVAQKYLKRRKKTPTHFYKEQEYTAEALEVHRVRSSSTFFLIFVLPTQIKYFFMKDLIDQGSKVYMVRIHQTLTYL